MCQRVVFPTESFQGLQILEHHDSRDGFDLRVAQVKTKRPQFAGKSQDRAGFRLEPLPVFKLCNGKTELHRMLLKDYVNTPRRDRRKNFAVRNIAALLIGKL